MSDLGIIADCCVCSKQLQDKGAILSSSPEPCDVPMPPGCDLVWKQHICVSCEVELMSYLDTAREACTARTLAEGES